MNVIERLNRLDERVLPMRLSAEEGPGWQIAYFIPVTMVGLMVLDAPDPWSRTGLMLVFLCLAVRAGRDVERLRIHLESQGRSLPFARLRRFSPALVLVVFMALRFVGLRSV